MTPHSYQKASIDHLLRVLPRNRGAVDGSDGGTGKTLVAVEVIKQLDLPTLVVCPKAVVPGWQRTGLAQATEFDVVNPEKLRTGNTPYGQWSVPKGRMRERFYFHPGVKFVVFDECHRYQGISTDNCDMMMATRRQGIQSLSLSATLADDPLQLKALGYVLGLHDGDDPPTLRNDDPLTFWNWARRHNCGKGAFSGMEFKGNEEKRMEVMRKISESIFPERGVRVRITDIPDFPETQITAELYDTDDKAKVQSLYADMGKQLEQVEASAREDFERALAKMPDELRAQALSDVADGTKLPTDFVNPLTNVLRIRQELELIKVPIFQELTQDALANGQSVVIFVNFQRTIEALKEKLKTNCVIDGTQTGAEREYHRSRFHNDIERVIIVNAEAGGVGLDLHDILGKYSRLALHSAGFNAKTIRQALLRVRRIGGKSKSLQRFIFLAGTYDEHTHRRVSRKLNNLDALNDRDLIPDNLRLTPGD